MRSGECFQQKMWEPLILENESSSWPTATTDMTSSRSKPYKQGGRPIAMVAEAWRTPSASDPVGGVKDLNSDKYRNAEAPKIKLRDQSASWRTPRATEYKNPDQSKKNKEKGLPVEHLSAQAKTWPTPCSTEVRQGFQDRSRGKKGSQESLTTVVLKREDTCQNQNAVIHTGPLAPAMNSNGQKLSESDQTSLLPKKRLSPTFVEWLMGLPIGWSLPIPIDQSVYKHWVTGSSLLLELLHSKSYLKG